MAIPFGFGIGDFLAVGTLIGRIIVELREVSPIPIIPPCYRPYLTSQNGEAAPDYQSLLLELEALGRALHQLENLQPTKHEFLQLNAIRATALTCQRPLQEFLAKISKFEGRLGIFNARDNRYKGFPRRMQWRMMYKEDAEQLRSTLGSHVATINLLLMTQTVRSISAAENDRERLACELQTKIFAHRRLLEDVKGSVEVSLEQQLETKLQLQDHSTALDNLGSKADQTHKRLQGQQSLIQDMLLMVSTTREQTTSILAAATDTLDLAMLGVMNLRLVAQQLSRMFELCTRFTNEMRATMVELMQLFFNLHTTLRRIEISLPMRVNLPILQFTDALGETMALPYQLCQQWATFRELLGVIFINKPGNSRVKMGQYLIMNANGGRLLSEASWQHAIKQGDHLSMSIVLDDLKARDGRCPFPSCQTSTEGVEVKNGGRTCLECGRWAVLTPQKPIDPLISNTSQSTQKESKINEESDKESEEELGEVEDIEIYRQIHVQTVADLLSDRTPDSADIDAPVLNIEALEYYPQGLPNADAVSFCEGWLRNYPSLPSDRQFEALATLTALRAETVKRWFSQRLRQGRMPDVSISSSSA